MHGVCKISVESSTTSLTNDIKMPKVTIMSSDSKQKPPSISKRRKDLFGDCALVEIIHLHDCLRGALQALEKDVSLLSSKIVANITSNKVHELRKKVASRFKVIWSVFQAHSSAEDEFIWPALAQKTNGQVTGSKPNNVVEQEEYEEDHADEERMFSHMDYLLTELKDGLLREHTQDQPDMEDKSSSVSTVKTLNEVTQQLSQHLMVHLEKEEQQCMPLVVKHLSKSEIHDLVGQIMGKRSSDMIAQILTMAVQNLNSDDRDEMVTYMKQAMAGTFFDRWLSMSGWMENDNNINKKKRSADSSQQQTETDNKRRNLEHTTETDTVSSNMSPLLSAATNRAAGVASQAELEKLIRAIAINPNLTSIQKNTTIQGLRDSVWKINQAANHESAVSATSGISSRRVTPPSIYYKKNGDGKNITVWNRYVYRSKFGFQGDYKVWSQFISLCYFQRRCKFEISR
jgi:iron-sulfur cluster repair protein YtfE (RIC family)